MAGVKAPDRPLAEAAAAFLALNAGACALASMLALGGAFNRYLDVLTHFALIYVAGALLAALLALPFPRRDRAPVVWFCGVTLAANAVLMVPEFLRDTAPAPPGPQAGQIKIIQFNALRTNKDVGPIVAWLISERPDFVTVTEARADLRDLLKARTGWQVAGAHGTLMIFSRRPRLFMDRPNQPPGAKLTFVNATYPSESGPLEVVTAHLDWPTHGDHFAQEKRLPLIVGARPRERMILAGDFNATPWSFGFRRMERRLGLIRRDRGLSTFPARVRGFAWPRPVLPIDHVYAGPGWRTVSVRRGPNLGSDHYPVVVVLAPAATGAGPPRPAGP